MTKLHLIAVATVVSLLALPAHADGGIGHPKTIRLSVPDGGIGHPKTLNASLPDGGIGHPKTVGATLPDGGGGGTTHPFFEGDGLDIIPGGQ